MTENEYLAEINAELATVGVRPCATLVEARRTHAPANPFEMAAEHVTRTGNGTGTAVRYADSATERQVELLVKLADEIAELNGVEITDLAEEFAALSKREASTRIDELMATARKLRERKWAQERAEREAARKIEIKVEAGIYLLNGVVHKVQKAVHGSGNLYAKVLQDGAFVYAPGAIRSLLPEHRMTLEQAKEYGHLYGVCCNCGATLTDEKSIEAGIGPVCAKKF